MYWIIVINVIYGVIIDKFKIVENVNIVIYLVFII